MTKNKEYMRIALKFLKELGLFVEWKEYLGSDIHTSRSTHDPNTHWSDKFELYQVFGQTLFTRFLREKKGLYIRSSGGQELCVYEAFQAYIGKHHSKHEYGWLAKTYLPICITKGKGGEIIKTLN